MTPNLPDWTWQLEAGDIDQSINYDWFGWCRFWIIEDQHARWFVYRELNKTIGTTEGEPVISRLCEYYVSHTLDHNARVWNTTMKRLGYDIDEGACL